MYYFVALGNPGSKYKFTRHNVGFLAADFFIKKMQLPETVKSAKYLGELSEGNVLDQDLSVLYPDTFMNHSGKAVKKLLNSPDSSNLVVIYDDVALPFGEVRVSFGRGDGGHNGIKSIIETLGTKDFIRLRIGVAPSSFWTGKMKVLTGEALPKFVLSNFTRNEQDKLEKEVFPKVKDVLCSILEVGHDKTMNRFN